MQQETVLRKALLSQPIPPREVRTVEVREITMAPGQKTGRHRHPCYLVDRESQLIEML